MKRVEGLMRYGIFSDVHSNIEALDAVVGAFKKEAIDKYLCIGDVVGYATNPKECIELVKRLCQITVAGNHDWATAYLFPLDYFNPYAKEAVLWTRQNLDSQDRYFLESLKLIYKNEDLTLVHGTLNEPQDFEYMADEYAARETFGLLETNICFLGHTHRAEAFSQDENSRISYLKDDSIDIKPENKYIINVGSVGQPRDGNPKSSYCTYDTEKKKVEIKRINYDIDTARKKILDAGLPRFLGDRLIIGK